MEPKLYFSPYGDTVDFRERIPTFSNIRLVKIDTRIWLLQIAFYTICGLVFLSALFYLPLRSLFRRVRQKKASVDVPAIRSPRSPRLVWTRMLAALASLFSLLILIIILLIPNMVYILAYIPLMHPYVDLLWWQFGLLSLPYVSLLLTVAIALVAIPGLKRKTEGRVLHSYYLFVAMALLAFNLTILI